MAFNIPVQTSFSKLRPYSYPTPWVRPSDWISITDSPNLVQFLVSDAVYPAYAIQTSFTQTGGVGNIYIDWGDGTSTTVSTTSDTNSEKTYTSGGTYSTQGYNMWKITISGDAGTRITKATFVNPTYWGAGNQRFCGLLEEYYGDNTINSISGLHYVTTTKPNFFSLRYSKTPAVISGTTSLQNAYVGCPQLEVVVLPTSMPGLISADSAFASCFNLQQVNLPQNGTGMTNMASMFQNCHSLTGITLPPTLPSATNLSNTFNSCYALSGITLPITPSCNNYAGIFANCYSLLSAEIPFLGSGATSAIQSMFQTCFSLEYVKFPTTVNPSTVFSANDMFNGCFNLKSVIFPTNLNASSLASTFRNCSSLTYVSMPTNMPSLASLNSTYLGCNALPEVIVPTTSAASIDIGGAFQNCSVLSSVVIPSGYTITSMASTFAGCSNLASVSLPTGAQNSISSMASAFNGCNNLTSVTLPSSLNSVISLATMFQNCYALTGVTFPSNMNSVATMGTAFATCINLRALTLPTSMSLLTTTGLQATFNGARSLTDIVLPATVNAGLTIMNGAFQNCINLRSVTLPTTQTTALNNVTSLFDVCPTLTGITNADKLGQNTTGGTILNGTSFLGTAFEMASPITLTCRLSKLTVNGIATGTLAKLNSLRLSNAGTGQWGGTSPQIDVSYTSLSTAALNLLFADIAAQGTVTSKTINITGASGAAGLSAGDRLVLTSRGWTITG